tara:strand:+ start:26235 stop:27746 length:1512 start_codon:yes stop_codon:yes gene_type:complete
MSTKINVRSPFYLNVTKPVLPLPEYTCGKAFPRGLNDTGFAVDNAGIVTEPTPQYGLYISFTCTASDFSNGKFATVTSDTVRTITAKMRIPINFSNTDDVFKECDITAIQPGVTASVVQPAVCSGGPTNNGSISAVSLNSGGTSTTINLSTKFNNATTYAISNSNPTLVSTSISGSNLIISSNAIGGSVTLYAIGRDASYPATCEAVQAISTTISLPAGSPDYTCNTAPLTGGGIAANGVITRPTTTGTILGVSTSQGGALLSPETTTPNGGASAQSITLYFKISAPPGYPNGGQVLPAFCPATFSQPGTALQDFSCSKAGLTGQSINDNGSINAGSAGEGTIVDWSPKKFAPVTSDTSRTVSFTVEIPNGYNNAGSNLSPACPLSLLQPASVPTCPGTNTYFLSAGKQLGGDFCDNTYSTATPVDSTGVSINELMGTKLCKGGNPFNGKGLRYGVTTFATDAGAGVGVGDFKIVQVDSNGTVLSVEIGNCRSGGNGKVAQML